MRNLSLFLILFLFIGHSKAEQASQVIVNDSSYKLAVQFFDEEDLHQNFQDLSTYYFNKDTWNKASNGNWIELEKNGGCVPFEDKAVIQVSEIFTLDDRDPFFKVLDFITQRSYPDEKHYDLLGMWNNEDSLVNFHLIRDVEEVLSDNSKPKFITKTELSHYKIFIEASKVDEPKCPQI